MKPTKPKTKKLKLKNRTSKTKGKFPKSNITNTSGTLFKEYFTLLHEEGHYDGNLVKIQPPLKDYVKDDRIEIRTSVEFKSFLALAGFADDLKSLSRLITESTFIYALSVITKKYPDLFGDSRKITEHSLSDIIMEIRKYYNPEFVEASKIFTNVVKKRKKQGLLIEDIQPSKHYKVKSKK